jgi:hypothetical protein
MSENTVENQELDKGALFLQAIQERMANLVVEYESKVAELRVEFTVLTQERDQLIEALKGQDAVQESKTKAK